MPAKATAKPTSSNTNTMKTRKKNYNSYGTYIQKVLKNVHPDISLTKESMSVMNSLLQDIYDRIVDESTKLVRRTKRQTLTDKDIESSIAIVFGQSELGHHA